eukprot:172871-Chlamydomonas_euryale.AAC.1
MAPRHVWHWAWSNALGAINKRTCAHVRMQASMSACPLHSMHACMHAPSYPCSPVRSAPPASVHAHK